MTTDQPTQKNLNIQIPDINKELKNLWKLPKDQNQTKACLFTLIVYAHADRTVKYLQEIIGVIVDKFPCRIIFIQQDESKIEPYINATVSIMTCNQGATNSSSLVACDQIDIKCSKEMLSRVPFIVIPQIVPDLPIYLLWGQNPFEEKEVFPHLKHYATRVIFDSECFDSLGLFCHDMQKSLKKTHTDIMDINWALTSHWRDIFSQIFDKPEKIEELRCCQSLELTYNESITETHKHPEIRSIYLQGWLAARLNWKYKKSQRLNKNIQITYDSPTGPIEIILIPQSLPKLPSGSIVSIEINTIHGCCYSIKRKPKVSQITVHTSTQELCELPFTLPLPDVHRGLTFMKEIFYNELGDHYQQMLEMINKLDFRIL